MDGSSILPYLRARSICLSQLVYSGSSVSVYIGQWRSCVSAIKIMALEPIDDYRRMERECLSMMRLQHPNIVKMYDCFWCSDSQRYYLVIVVEWCNKDVMKDIQERRNARVPWREDKLWSVVRGLVSALAYMQREGFAHRDIKPQNLFIVSENLIKIGDFGSGRFTDPLQSVAKMTLIGTPFFLSPLLKHNLMGDRSGTVHNAFKSDVYSLGLTLLLMTSQYDQSALTPVITQANSLWSAIQAISYSDNLKSMLWWMLQEDESDRCDFLQLSQWLNFTPDYQSARVIIAVQSRICMQCGSSIASIQREVTLECDPTHQFCSSRCFNTFLHERSPACPKCLVPINSAFFQQSAAPVVDVQNPSVSAPKLCCLQCFSVIDLNKLSVRQSVVQLFCEPSQHMFCDFGCLRLYMNAGASRCPICKVDIDPDILSELSESGDGKVDKTAIDSSAQILSYQQRGGKCPKDQGRIECLTNWLYQCCCGSSG